MSRDGLGEAGGAASGAAQLRAVKVLDLQGALDHRDVCFSDDQHQRGDRTCTGVSRAVSPATAGAVVGGRETVLTIDIPWRGGGQQWPIG
jgi:hypothetical protein